LFKDFERAGGLEDISEAISILQQVVQLSPNGHPDVPGTLDNLGISFHARFACMGDLSDLSDAISAHQRAVQPTPEGHPEMPGVLNNLGNSFLSWWH